MVISKSVLKAVLDGVSNEGKSILYIDEIHNIIGAGKIDKGSLDASNTVKSIFGRRQVVRLWVQTTYDEYKQNFIRDKAFRRFEMD